MEGLLWQDGVCLLTMEGHYVERDGLVSGAEHEVSDDEDGYQRGDRKLKEAWKDFVVVV